MIERMTSINLPGVFGSGLADFGRKSPAEMVNYIRVYAKHQRAIFEAILAAEDSDFHIVTYIGVHVRRGCSVLQEGREKLMATT